MPKLDKLIAFNTTQDEAKRFDRKCPSKGQKSKVLRALLQQYLDGKITNLVFRVEEKLP